jgi:hypothetical protein
MISVAEVVYLVSSYRDQGNAAVSGGRGEMPDLRRGSPRHTSHSQEAGRPVIRLRTLKWAESVTPVVERAAASVPAGQRARPAQPRLAP